MPDATLRANACPDEDDVRLPVTVLSGFLGAGKTTLLKKILREPPRVIDKVSGKERPWRIALIVNDMGAINLDADEIKHSKLIQEEAEMVELQNGCVCCTLRGDLLKSVKRLSEERAYDYLVIESTGISEPLPVAQTFVMNEDDLDHDHEGDDEEEEEEGREEDDVEEEEEEGGDEGEQKDKLDALSKYARLDTMATVVDAVNIFDVLHSIETLADKKNATGMTGNENAEGEEEDDRSIVQLFLDQVEYANVVVVSKICAVVEQHGEAKGMRRANAIKTLLNKINPEANVLMPLEPMYGDLDTKGTVVDTCLFKLEEAEQTDAWMRELAEEHVPETEEYGISSVVFESNEAPFHPERLDAVIKGFGHYVPATSGERGGSGGGGDFDPERQPFRGVFRTKGQVWLANANAYPMTMQTAGRTLQLEPKGLPFFDAVPKEEWDSQCHEVKETMAAKGRWHATNGDRHSRLVLIGVDVNKDLIKRRLQAALVTPEETAELGGVDGWRMLRDPFFEGHAAREFFEAHMEEEEEDDDEEKDEEEDVATQEPYSGPMMSEMLVGKKLKRT